MTPLGPLPIDAVTCSVGTIPANKVTSSPQQSPPLLVDLTGDGTLDAITVTQAGAILLRLGVPGQPGAFGVAQQINAGAVQGARPGSASGPIGCRGQHRQRSGTRRPWTSTAKP